MALSWNEIRERAVSFSKEWANDYSEDAEAKSFWDGFFNIFGVTRRRIASFEAPVKKFDGKGGYIDLLWKGVLLVEHKSRGKDLERAFNQAIDYFPGIKERDLPRYVLVSDFARLRLYDLDESEIHEFSLRDLHKNIRLFGFIAGYQTRSFSVEDPVNIKAAEQLGKLHDHLKTVGYEGHHLEVFLVRLLFSLFAEDTGIFEKQSFREYLESRTSEDGSDLGMHLAQFFQILNTSTEKRLKNLDEQLAAFPYVNGRLFEEVLPLTSFDKKMREILLDCSALDWSRISPAIFGSLFQSIMDKAARRNLGAHYTREANILKVLRPLFLEGLWTEFESLKRSPKRLLDFHKKLASIRIFDPACGCGNFLVIAYRELRLIELNVLRELHKSKETGFLNVGDIVWIDVDQFYGIEIEEFPAQIAQVALWLTDHQMNLRVSEEFGQYFVRLPLKKAPNILNGNSLTCEWEQMITPERLTYIVGNPPFVGKKEQNETQKAEVLSIFKDVKGAGVLDYVACWYQKALEFMSKNHSIKAAFVSTNSITQGEQVGILWPGLFAKGIKIHFAHRTFQWSSEARGKAAVHCVVIGFGLEDTLDKWLFEYENLKSEPHVVKVNNINAYLVPAENIFVDRRSKPICKEAPEMNYGSMPIDNGWLILSSDERDELLAEEPNAKPFIRPYMGGDEFLNGIHRYCLWLVNCNPAIIRQLKKVSMRVEGNRSYRLKSDRKTTVELADKPYLFGEIRQPQSPYLLIPKVSSMSRDYVPIGFCSPDIIASGTTLIIPNATLYEFGILQSVMHISWMRAICGRMKSDYQYSAAIVYNNFIWPTPTENQKEAIHVAAKVLLDVRTKYSQNTLADLYDPISMPADLLKAHKNLDSEVDKAYGKKKFENESERIAFVFELYKKEIAPLMFISNKGIHRRKS